MNDRPPMRYLGHATFRGNTPAAKSGVIVYAEASDGKTWWEQDPAQMLEAPVNFDGRPASMRGTGVPKFCREYYWTMNPKMLRWTEARVEGMSCLVVSAYAIAGMPAEVSFAKLFAALKGIGLTLGYARLCVAMRDPVNDPLPERVPNSDMLPAPMDLLPKVAIATEHQATQAIAQAKSLKIVK